MGGLHFSGTDVNKPEDNEREDLAASQHNKRLGMLLFVIYLATYLSYMAVNALWPSLMDKVPFAGLNLAVLWGMGLIFLALVLSLVYAWLCVNSRHEGKS